MSPDAVVLAARDEGPVELQGHLGRERLGRIAGPEEALLLGWLDVHAGPLERHRAAAIASLCAHKASACPSSRPSGIVSASSQSLK